MVIFDFIVLFSTIAIVLFLPGALLAKVILKKEFYLLDMEKLVLSFGMSIAIVDFSVLFADYLNISLNRINLLAILLAVCTSLWFWNKHTKSKATEKTTPAKGSLLQNEIFSYRYILIFCLILGITILIRTIYIGKGILPQSTDLGHHMYWANYIAQNHALPDYGMPDFIIGEHIIFGVISAISGVSVISAMPVIVLLIINIFSLLAIFIVTIRIASTFWPAKTAGIMGLFALISGGIFYALSSPQAKFVSGGVIGNIVGNLFMPLALYCFIMIAKKKSASMVSIFIIICATLAYTHHLSTFIFLFVFASSLLFMVIFSLIFYRFKIKELWAAYWTYLKLFISPKNLALISAFLLFLIIFHPPSYLNASAIDTAVGTPIKETRTGLTINSLILTAGPWRFFYAAIGAAATAFLVISAHLKKSTQFRSIADIVSFVLPVSWLAILFIMSNQPALLKIDIPSGRIASYITIPVIILSAIGAWWLVELAKNKLSFVSAELLFIVIMMPGFVSGLADISEKERIANSKEVYQTYQGASYLAEKTNEEDVILKDHIYLAADAWIKNFIMRDYKNPLSRSFLKRYNDIAKERETCTRDMIAMPDSETGKSCFAKTKTKYVMMKQGFDTEQFDRSENFSKIYASPKVSIYKLNDFEK